MGRICHTGLPQKISQTLGQETKFLDKHVVSPKVYFSPISFKQIPIFWSYITRKRQRSKRRSRCLLGLSEKSVTDWVACTTEIHCLSLKNNVIYLFIFWLYWVFVAAHGLSLVAMSERGLLFVAVLWFLLAVASRVAEHRL
jgi:hypothetical protein